MTCICVSSSVQRPLVAIAATTLPNFDAFIDRTACEAIAICYPGGGPHAIIMCCVILEYLRQPHCTANC